MSIVTFADRITALAPTTWYRLGETTSTFANSGSQGTAGTLSGSATRGVDGLVKDANKAVTLTGGTVSAASLVSTSGVGVSVGFSISFGAVSVDQDVIRIGNSDDGSPNLRVRSIGSASWRVNARLSSGASQQNDYSAPGGLVVGRTYRVVVVRAESGTITLYVNAREVGSATGFTLAELVNSSLTLGATGCNYTIDEVVVHNGTVWTTTQVRNDYLSAVGGDDSSLDIYCSPVGTYTGAGTSADPLELNAALRYTGHQQPGCTIWLKAGDYTGEYQIDLRGTAGARCYIKNVRGEHARILTLASPTLSNIHYLSTSQFTTIDGDGTRYAGGIKSIEVANLNGGRIDPVIYPAGLAIMGGNDHTVKNIYVRDTGGGFIGYDLARNVKIVGTIITNVGYLIEERGSGHGVYHANENTTHSSIKSFIGCMMLNSFGQNIKADSVSGGCQNIHIIDTINSNAGYPQVNYRLDALCLLAGGGSRADGAMTATSAVLTGSSFVSGDVGKMIRVAGAGRGGAALLTWIKTFTSATSVTLGNPAQTTVSSASYKYAANANGTWTYNTLIGSAGFERINKDIEVTRLDAWMSDWACTTGHVLVGYDTAYNENCTINDNRIVGGLSISAWRNVTGSQNKISKVQLPNLSADKVIAWSVESIRTLFLNQVYATGTYVKDTPNTGRIYKCTVAGQTGSSQPTWPTGSAETVVSGAATFRAPYIWSNGATYAKDDIVVGTTFQGSTSFWVKDGGVAAGSEPSWNTTQGALTTSGGVIFEALGDCLWLKPYEADQPWNNNQYHYKGHSGSVAGFLRSGYLAPGPSVNLSFAQWQASGLDADSSFSAALPTTNEIRYHWQDPNNDGLAGRGIIAVFNWELATSVTIDLTGSGLVEDQVFEIRDGEDLHNTILASGTYGTGGSKVTSIAVSTQGTQITPPVDYDFDFQTTKPDFMALIVLPGAIAASDVTAPTLTSATIDATGLILTLVFSEAVVGLALADYALSTGHSLTNLGGTTTTWTMTVTQVYTGVVTTLAYTGTATEDLAGNNLATFSGTAVTNNSLVAAPSGSGSASGRSADAARAAATGRTAASGRFAR